jgi:hypothetical protein
MGRSADPLAYSVCAKFVLPRLWGTALGGQMVTWQSAPIAQIRTSPCCVATYGLEAASMKATIFDFSLFKSSSRRYIMWPAS